MPFNPDYKYRRDTGEVTHVSVPPRGCGGGIPRGCGVIYLENEAVGIVWRLEDNKIQRAEIFKSALAKVVPDFTQTTIINVPFDLWVFKVDNTLKKYLGCWFMEFMCCFDAGTKFVFEDATFTFKSTEESQVEM